nr:immunoglobulin heavy chain junction region [Mus musculus]
CARLGDYW